MEMTEKELDKAYRLFDAILTPLGKFNGNMQEETSHGVGFNSRETRESYIAYADSELEKITHAHNQFKAYLQSIDAKKSE